MIYLTPDGLLTTQDDPNAIEAYANISGGYLDAALRSDTLAAWEKAAVNAGLCLAESEEHPRKRGHLQNAPGVSISHIGPVVTTPAVTDALGEVITPAVMDTRHHVNVRLNGAAMAAVEVDEDGNPIGPKWARILARWMTKGRKTLRKNKRERVKKLKGVELIDADLIATPVNHWL